MHQYCERRMEMTIKSFQLKAQFFFLCLFLSYVRITTTLDHIRCRLPTHTYTHTHLYNQLSCVDEHDKSVAMGFGLMLMGFAFIPSPIFFGAILDNSCLVWGKTCSGTGNCWLYDGRELR